MLYSKLDYLFQYYTAPQLGKLLNVKHKDPGRYFRKIRSGQIKKTKYESDIDFLYDDVRRSETPPPRKKSFQKKAVSPKRVKPSLAFTPLEDVISTLSYIFDPQTFNRPKKEHKWIHKNSRLLVKKESYPSGIYNTWVGFFIFIYFLSRKDARLKRYQRAMPNRMNKQMHFTLGMLLENYLLSDKQAIDYLLPELEDTLKELASRYHNDSPIMVSFLATKLSTPPISADKAINSITTYVSKDILETGNEKLDGDGKLEFVDIYAITGWNHQ